MPGPGQGKWSNKKKWHENTLSMNIATVNTIMMASSTTTLNMRMTTLTTLPPSMITAAAEFTDEATPEKNQLTYS
jgi:hypothetical protein